MKGVIVESKDGYVALLKDDGTFARVKDKGYRVGQIIEIKGDVSMISKRVKTLIATAAMIAVMLTSGMFAYGNPSYYVSMDVNPGIIMEVNFLERVIGVEALNKEAKEVLEGLDLKNMNIEEAVQVAVEKLIELGYLANEEGKLIITSSAKNQDKAEKLTNKLREKAEMEMKEDNSQAEVIVDAVGYEMVQSARALEDDGIYITPGKYNIIKNLLGEEVTIENSSKSVKELMSIFTERKKLEGRENSNLEDDDPEDEEFDNGKGTPNMGNPQAGNKAPITPPGLIKAKDKVDNIKEVDDIEAIEDEEIEDEEIEEGKKPEEVGKPEKPEKPETPANPETPNKPETPAGGNN